MEFNKEQMRALGYRASDMVVDHLDSLRDKPATRRASRKDLEFLREPVPEQPGDSGELLDLLERDVFPRAMHTNHPRFFAFVPSPGNYISVLGDLLASGHNVFAGTWLEASAPGEIELTTLDWLRQMFGLAEGWSGLFTSGGSMANLTALIAAGRALKASRAKPRFISATRPIRPFVGRSSCSVFPMG